MYAIHENRPSSLCGVPLWTRPVYRVLCYACYAWRVTHTATNTGRAIPGRYGLSATLSPRRSHRPAEPFPSSLAASHLLVMTPGRPGQLSMEDLGWRRCPTCRVRTSVQTTCSTSYLSNRSAQNAEVRRAPRALGPWRDLHPVGRDFRRPSRCLLQQHP